MPGKSKVKIRGSGRNGATSPKEQKLKTSYQKKCLTKQKEKRITNAR